jgi:hypothetical protein
MYECFVYFVGHILEDGRIDHHAIQGGQMTPASIYGATRVSSNSNSPGNAQTSALLVVPQPINATKISGSLPNGTGRKYQCKMCPQVSLIKIFQLT